MFTTVESPLAEMGHTAAELILEKIKDPSSPNRSVVLNAEIRVRASTANFPVTAASLPAACRHKPIR